MSAKMKEFGQWFILGFVVVMSALLSLRGADARIPEPDNIIYGNAGADTVTVSLQIDGQVVASYTIGENPDAGDYYILRVPMDALDPAEPSTGHTGDEADIFVNNETQPVATLTLGERGGVQLLNLDGTDNDNDGLPDEWEQQIVDADPNDGIVNISDVLPGDDFDGDGENNGLEFANNTNPINAMSARRGDINDDRYIDLSDVVMALQVTSGIATGQTVSMAGDANADGQIGTQEALFLLQRMSGAR